MFRHEMKSATHQVVHKDSSRQVGVDQGNGDGISGGGKRLGDALVVNAVAPVAGNLRDLKDLQLRSTMLAGIADEFVSDLLWCGHAGVGKDAPFESAGKVRVENDARKIGAIVIEQLEVGAIFCCVQALDQSLILRCGGFKAKGKDPPFIGYTDELCPSAAEETAGGKIVT